MKFGQYLQENQFQPWNKEYLQYDDLKQYLKSTQLSPQGWTTANEAYFIDRIQQEFYKLKSFTEFKIHQISEDMRPERISDLIKFIQINSTGFQKIVKKHDKWTGLSLRPRLVDISKQLDDFITQLSLQQQWTTTRKYWVHEDHLKEVQAILLFNLPMQLDNEITNTIYFDNSNSFNGYSELVEHKDLAKIVRARWYGTMTENTMVQLEKKIYHKSYFKNKGIYTKEGVQLLSSQVSPFLLTGNYQGPDPDLAESLFDDARRSRSTLRCFHYRTLFQQVPHFRISLDTQITLIKEMGLDWKRSAVGDTYPFSHVDEIYHFPFAVLEIKSSSANKQLPAWIHDLMDQRLVYEVPFFSKYLHGASHFFRDRVSMLPWWLDEMDKDIRKQPSYAVHVVPEDSAIHTTSSCTVVEPKTEGKISFYADKWKHLKNAYDPVDEANHVSMTHWLYAKFTRTLQRYEEEAQVKRVEPKIHFANERTFISWLQFSALLMTVSLGLINFGDDVSKGSGAFFIILAIFLAFYAELRFQYRSWQIRFRETQRFDDMIGPAILCFVLVIALFINLGLRMNQPLPVDPSPFKYNTTTVYNETVVGKQGRVFPTEEDDL